MPSTFSASRVTSYTAGLNDLGDATLFAAWIKTVTFNANSATTGTVPASQVYVAGGDRIKLPTFSEMTLRKPGYEFLGWSTTATGSVVSSPSSYEPLVSQQTLYAIWRVQTTKATERVFFKPGKSTLRAAQKLVLRDLVDTVRGKPNINFSLVSNRAKVSTRALGKARNAAVVAYIRSLGVTAKFVRKNNVSSTNLSTSKKVNRVTIQAVWTNPN
jgi:outer membrane protein OmpA-like peptidoglycan-associated protein